MSRDITVIPRREVVVVTGSGTAAGRAIARRFALDGAEIGVIGRGRSGMRRCAEEILTAGGDAVVCQCDTTEHAAVEAAARLVEQTFGPIDTWVNAAPSALVAAVSDAPEHPGLGALRAASSAAGARVALDGMIARGRGTLVQLCHGSDPEQADHSPARRAHVRVVRVLWDDPEATAARVYDAAHASRWRRPSSAELRQDVGGATS